MTPLPSNHSWKLIKEINVKLDEVVKLVTGTLMHDWCYSVKKRRLSARLVSECWTHWAPPRVCVCVSRGGGGGGGGGTIHVYFQENHENRNSKKIKTIQIATHFSLVMRKSLPNLLLLEYIFWNLTKLMYIRNNFPMFRTTIIFTHIKITTK